MTRLHPDTSGSTAPMRRQRGMPEASDGLERVAQDLAAQKWIFAKTMPENPHEYTLRKLWRSDADFVHAVRFIRAHGYRNLFEGGGTRSSTSASTPT